MLERSPIYLWSATSAFAHLQICDCVKFLLLEVFIKRLELGNHSKGDCTVIAPGREEDQMI